MVYPEYYELHDTLTVAAIDQNIGNIHYQLKEYEKAIHSFHQARWLF